MVKSITDAIEKTPWEEKQLWKFTQPVIKEDLVQVTETIGPESVLILITVPLLPASLPLESLSTLISLWRGFYFATTVCSSKGHLSLTGTAKERSLFFWVEFLPVPSWLKCNHICSNRDPVQIPTASSHTSSQTKAQLTSSEEHSLGTPVIQTLDSDMGKKELPVYHCLVTFLLVEIQCPAYTIWRSLFWLTFT